MLLGKSGGSDPPCNVSRDTSTSYTEVVSCIFKSGCVNLGLSSRKDWHQVVGSDFVNPSPDLVKLLML